MRHEYERAGKREALTFRETTDLQPRIDYRGDKQIADGLFFTCEAGRRMFEAAQDEDDSTFEDRVRGIIDAAPPEEKRLYHRRNSVGIAAALDMLESVEIEGAPALDPENPYPLREWLVDKRFAELQRATARLFGEDH